jgi:hypothetical protein
LSQFNLRTLLLVVALLAIVFAIARLGGWGAVAAAGTFGALVLAHVIGNALGTRLRDEISPQLNPKPAPPEPAVIVRRWEGKRRLHERTPLSRLISITSGGAAVVGAVLGGSALAAWTSAGVSGWLVGTVSSAVVGGFVGFLLSSFLDMTFRALSQAMERE